MVILLQDDYYLFYHGDNEIARVLHAREKPGFVGIIQVN